MRFLILGSGPAGYAAASTAAALGAEVTIVDRMALGGNWTMTDGIPSKTLLQVASSMAEIERAEQRGLVFEHGRPRVDLLRAEAHARFIGQHQSRGVRERLDLIEATIVYGQGAVERDGLLVVTTERAALFADSRYWVQAESQLAGSGIELVRIPTPAAAQHLDWLCANVARGATVAVDGSVLGLAAARQMRETLARCGITLRSDLDVVATAVVVGDALGCCDLIEGDAVLVIAPVGAVHDEAPPAAGLHLHLLDGGGKAVRPPPVFQVRGVRPGFEDQRARGIEDAGGDDFTICGLAIFAGHVASPFSACP